MDELVDEPIGRRAEVFWEFSIYDANNEHVVTLRLRRKEGMTRGDMGQLQNFIWVNLGQSIRNDMELRKTLELGGVEVILDDPRSTGASDAN